MHTISAQQINDTESFVDMIHDRYDMADQHIRRQSLQGKAERAEFRKLKSGRKPRKAVVS